MNLHRPYPKRTGSALRTGSFGSSGQMEGNSYQSDLVKVLGIPKSTLSSTLNDLHRRQIIIKVKKGRENLIRLAEEPGNSSSPIFMINMV